jgi:hypothetical protein
VASVGSQKFIEGNFKSLVNQRSEKRLVFIRNSLEKSL